jgi:hypothetical protein
MHGVVPLLPQYAFMAWFSVKKTPVSAQKDQMSILPNIIYFKSKMTGTSVL